ncbi:TetR family transcriptional regulator [Sinomonas cellulolyticus]|uniref:TetR/AcrR family transcriptional regulator n=1 Tax=Sinomonas cellulolyticus TaxID=2801916 RepID=A0ABS1K4V9_9MICC|nr:MULTISPECIES: TetR/AcrR family transcriptional regulator [Sinomonas]MBL0706670.1 TetR/AcrR family transcriptional regulator [Sinomonas cellulolyticus]GHG56055.1 TetR family transcriptional regulator [Sinomonas sp. KCTC 49339]
MSEPSSPRVQAKAERRQAILDAAAGLFAAQGFPGASLEDLGAAAGVSGPAIYRHFPGKQAVLGALLTGVSEDLLAGGQRVAAAEHDDAARLRALVDFHVDFALRQPDVIRVQDRDFPSLAEEDRERVRALQLAYVDVWVGALRTLHPGVSAAELRLRAQAVFGLINSTPHSVRRNGGRVAASPARRILTAMALAALTAPA